SFLSVFQDVAGVVRGRARAELGRLSSPKTPFVALVERARRGELARDLEAAATHRHQLAGDRGRDLLDGHGAHVEPDRRAHALEPLEGKAPLARALEDLPDLDA